MFILGQINLLGRKRPHNERPISFFSRDDKKKQNVVRIESSTKNTTMSSAEN